MSDIIRFIAFLSVIMLIFIVIGYLVCGLVGIFAALIFFGLLNLVFYFYSDKIILKFYKASRAEKKKYKSVYDVIETFSEEAGISQPNLYIVKTTTPCAFLVGKGQDNASIVLTTGLVQLCDEREMEAVISYEFACIVNNSMLLGTFSATVAGVFSFLPEWLLWKMSIRSKRKEVMNVLLVVFAPFLVFSAVVVRLAMSSSQVFEADAAAAKISKKPKNLASALVKIDREIKYRPLKYGTCATIHLFIVNPFNGSVLSNLFSIFPPTDKRTERLDKLLS
ncbi:MAG: M48 family metalloprotease [archaeon]|nr:M48 family metalloprotease [archaeon]